MSSIRPIEKVKPLILLGAGASKPFGIPTMPEFLDAGNDPEYSEKWRDLLNGRGLPAGVAVRRSLHFIRQEYEEDFVDLEEVMFLLDQFAEMNKRDPLASFFLDDVKKETHIKVRDDFNSIKQQAKNIREELRNIICRECSEFNQEKVKKIYSKFFPSLLKCIDSNTIYIATTNYDRIIEYPWEHGINDVDKIKLKDGFRGNRVRTLDTNTYANTDEVSKSVVELIKLHGSVGWRRRQNNNGVEVVDNPAAPEYQGNQNILAYPVRSDKSDEPPFNKLFSVFDDALENANLMIIIGLSLRDDAIKRRVNKFLMKKEHPGLENQAIIIDPDPEPVLNELDENIKDRVEVIEKEFISEISPTKVCDWEALFDRICK